jgi:hypothetical protein
MPTTRPTDTPEWATAPSGGATVDEPPGGLQARGWIPFNKPPSGFVNWAWNRFSDWAAHFASLSSSFPTLQDAVEAPLTAPLNVGDSCLIDEIETVVPGAVELDVATTAGIAPVFGVTSGGQYLVYVASAPQIFRVVERDGSAVIRTWAPTNPFTTLHDIKTDGVDVIFSYDDATTTTVECFDITTGLAKWTVTPIAVSTFFSNLAIDDERVYLVGDTPAQELVVLNKSTGATVYVYDHSGVATAPLRSVATNGRLVFVAGDASGHASAATLRGIIAATGFDVGNEGGLGADATGVAWNQVQANLTGANRSMDTDGSTLYVIQNVGVNAALSVRGCGSGAEAANVAIRNNSGSCWVDQDYIVTSSSAEITALAKTSLAEAWLGAAPGGFLWAITDGTAVFASGGNRLARGNLRPQRFRRVDPTAEKSLPMRQLIVPVEFS